MAMERNEAALAAYLGREDFKLQLTKDCKPLPPSLAGRGSARPERRGRRRPWQGGEPGAGGR
jgi:hypothetical protein